MRAFDYYLVWFLGYAITCGMEAKASNGGVSLGTTLLLIVGWPFVLGFNLAKK